MDSGNLDIKKKYEELDLLQKARELLRAKNIEAKEKYPSS